MEASWVEFVLKEILTSKASGTKITESPPGSPPWSLPIGLDDIDPDGKVGWSSKVYREERSRGPHGGWDHAKVLATDGSPGLLGGDLCVDAKRRGDGAIWRNDRFHRSPPSRIPLSRSSTGSRSLLIRPQREDALKLQQEIAAQFSRQSLCPEARIKEFAWVEPTPQPGRISSGIYGWYGRIEKTTKTSDGWLVDVVGAPTPDVRGNRGLPARGSICRSLSVFRRIASLSQGQRRRTVRRPVHHSQLTPIDPRGPRRDW